MHLDDDTIDILYQTHIIDSTSGIRVYAFLCALLKGGKRQMNERMLTTPDIEQAPPIWILWRKFGMILFAAQQYMSYFRKQD
jgi:hypothetical protein